MRVMGFDRQDDPVKGTAHLGWRCGPHTLGEALNRALNSKAVTVHGVHVVLCNVHQQDVFAGAGQIRAQSSANGASAPDQNSVLVHVCALVHRASIKLRVSSTATDQTAFISSSERW